jgi:hypothetical protein
LKRCAACDVLTGLGEFVEDAFNGVEWFVWGLIQLVLLFLILRPLEAWLPVHHTQPLGALERFYLHRTAPVGAFRY